MIGEIFETVVNETLVKMKKKTIRSKRHTMEKCV